MKKQLTLFLTLMLPVIVLSQAVIVFDTKEHDFGKIKEEDGRASYEFVFTNQGNEPLVVNKVQASCGCTTPSWTKNPVEPGQKGTITVIYNPAGRPGVFSKSITVQSNATTERLSIKGDVIAKSGSKNTTDPFSVKMGNVSLDSRIVNFNNIEKGSVSGKHQLKIKNTSKEAVKLAFANVPAYISVIYDNPVLVPDAESDLLFTFDSERCSKWGPVSDEIYLVLNDKKDISDTYKITLTSNIVEDFGKMTTDQKRNAPILEISNRNIDFGVLNASIKADGSFRIKNIGEKNLEIRRVINNNKEISFKQEQLSVRGGKTGELKFNCSTSGLAAGKYKRAITLQTNDPENVYIVLSIEWEIK